jgi:hypothetical protein
VPSKDRYEKPIQWPPLKRGWRIRRGWREIMRATQRLGKPLIVIVALGVTAYTAYSHRASLSKMSRILTPRIREIALSANPFFKRPAMAPNGSPWPAQSGYVEGYPRLNVLGMAQVTADNSGTLNDVFIKLIDRDRKPMTAVRVFFVRGKDKLVLDRVKPGHYDLRYLNLDTGQIFRSAPFVVTLQKTASGEQYRGWTIGLYGRVDGTSHRDEISEHDF